MCFPMVFCACTVCTISLCLQLEQRWLKYENHAQIVQEQEEKRKQLLEEEKQKKIRRREKIFKILQERENCKNF